MRGKTATIVQMALVAALMCAWATTVRAQEGEEGEEEQLTVAVFNFQTKGKGVADMSEKVADLLTVFLSMEEDLQLVERAEIKRILEEMELGASGIVDPGKAARIGGMLGAQVLITGSAFVVNEKLYLTGKAISVETSRVNAQLAKSELDEDLDVPVQELAAKLSEWLAENAEKMVAKIETPADQVDALRKALGRMDLPTMTVVVVERHIGQATIDPAAETEVMYLLRKVGVIVTEGRKTQLKKWAGDFIKDQESQLPRAARKVDVIIVGEGFSEFAGRKGNLLTVKARVELKAVDTKTGQILAVHRKTATHVDLAEQIAGKAALQKAAGQAAVEMIPEAVEAWNKLREQEAAEENKD